MIVSMPEGDAIAEDDAIGNPSEFCSSHRASCVVRPNPRGRVPLHP